MNEQQEKWLRRVSELFMRYGIKSVTMDDVARELGISKKTLYLFVESKDDLVVKVLERHIETEKEECIRIDASSENAVEEMLLVIQSNSEQVKKMKSNIVYDLQKYHREAWEKMQAFQQGFLYNIIKANLERGIKEGLYRDDLNVEIITRLHLSQTFTLFDESYFPPELCPRELLFNEYLKQYLRGILSEKGLQVLKAKMS